MASNFKKIIIIIAVIFIILLFFGAGIGFFLKERDEDISDQNNKQEEQQRPENSKKTELIKKEELTKEERLRIFSENFAVIYYSYTWGNFSNIETQYDYMSEKMKNEEKNRVEQMKQKIESQPRKYSSARAKLINSEVLLYGENEAEIIVNLNITNFAGAIIQKKTMTWVDEKGDPYIGDINNLIISSKNKKIKINFIKVNDKWKVDEIEDVKE
jgi:hypothetical protein